MFSFLRKNVLPRRRGSLSSFKYSSSMNVRFVSTDSRAHNSFAFSYLINTCGLSQQKAISAIKRVHFESTENPDAVITFFRDNGFSNTHISKVIGTHPFLLCCSVDKTLKPKFKFFKSQGISGSDFAQILCGQPNVLKTSLEKKIIPCFEFIRSIVHTDAELLSMLKRSSLVLMQVPQKNLLPNVALLRAEGVPADNILKLLISEPRVLLKPTSRFGEIVEEVKKMKFDPQQYQFLKAVWALVCMSRSSLEAKFDAYRKWGLSKDEVQLMFRKKPQTLMLSEKNIMSTMNCIVNEMGYTPSLIVEHPTVTTYSLTRRISPRCSVIHILKIKGLVGDDCRLYSFLSLPEETFLKKYVIKFEKEIPELLSTYHRKRDE